MDDERDFRKRRIALAVATAGLLVLADNHPPRIGTISITLDDTRRPHVDAALAPPLDTVAAVAVMAMERLTR